MKWPRSPINRDKIICSLAYALLWMTLSAIAAMWINFTGDCSPDVVNCGQGERRLSFLIIVLGISASAISTVRCFRK